MSDGAVRVRLAGRTDVGLIREHNEDNLCVLDLERGRALSLDGQQELMLGPGGALLMVCDGMGGAAAGEVAAQMAVDEISGFLLAPTPVEGDAPSEAATLPYTLADGAPEQASASNEPLARVRFARRLRAAAQTANRRIHDEARNNARRSGMGTTMTAAGVYGGHLVVAQVGDSRAYLLRDGRLVQVTRDQSLVNQLIELGEITEEQAKHFEYQNVILQALGVQETVDVQLSTVSLRRGDRLVVCSDGLTGVVEDDELAAILGSSDDMDEVCRLLIEMARAGGGPDNITAVTALFDGDELPRPAPSDQVRYSPWHIDEPEAAPTEAPELDPDDPARPPLPSSSSPTPTRPARSSFPSLGRASAFDPAQLFFSLMVLLAVALGGLVVGTLLRRSSSLQRCLVEGAPGLELRVDGRAIGLSTSGSGATVRLTPGRHRVGLRGAGAPIGDREVDVMAGTACQVRFDEGAQ